MPKKNKTKTKKPISSNADLVASPTVAPVSGGSSNTALLVVIIVLLSIIILGTFGWLGWKWWKSKSKFMNRAGQMAAVEQPVTTPRDEMTYEDKEFGYRLRFTPAWKSYRPEKQTIGGDFEVLRTCFFLPTKYPEYTGELPDYTSPFCISAFVASSWDEEQKSNSSGLLPMGEVVGRNSRYVFVYSHFNGNMPPDVPQQAVLDMQIIAEGIEVFEPSFAKDSEGKIRSYGDSGNVSFSNPAGGTRPVVDPDFQMTGIYYWNCKHRYTLTYPTAWSNNGMTYNSGVVILKGNQIQIWIEAAPIGVMETLQGFAEKRAAKIEGNLAWLETIDWNGEATVFRATYANPDSTAMWWLAGDYGMELRAFGPGYNNEYANIQNTIATLDPNIMIAQCGASSSKTSDYAPQPVKKETAASSKKKACSFPNGDVEYWWGNASASERDCFIQNGGIPPASYEP
jgi:hypothetical protein